MDPLFTPAEVATLLRVKLRTLETWRYRRQGPGYTKIGGRVYYPQPEIEAYLATRTVKA